MDKLCNLATNGLQMEDYEIKRHVENNRSDITTSSHSLLIDWRNTQEDSKTAHTNMCDALRRVGMQFLVKELL